MVQKIVVICDVHSNMEEPSMVDGATSYRVSRVGGQEYTVDLCPECFQTYAEAFFELAAAVGQRTIRRRKRRKRSEMEPESTEPAEPARMTA